MTSLIGEWRSHVCNSTSQQMQGLNEQSYRTHPDPNIKPTTVSFEAINVESATPRRAKKAASSVSCLVIGFDTEYQTFAPVTPDDLKVGKARNEILSYQFSIKLIYQSPLAAPSPEAEGIIIPDNDQRIPLQNFISIAVGALIAKYPGLQVPEAVYLVGHFTRADLPAFSEFSNPAKSFLSNVRNTFVSINTFIPIEIVDKAGAAVAKFKVYLRDTMLLSPASAKSLAAVGEIVGFKKISLADDRGEELHIKKHMKEFRANRWEEFRQYAIRDAQVCVQYAQKVIQQYGDLFGEFKLPITLTQFGTRLVLNDWAEAGWDPDRLLGREKVKKRTFSKKRGYMITQEERPYIEEVHYESAFVTETYHGGRNEQFAFGICPEGAWRDHDLSSAYTTAMSLIGTPDWASMRRLTEFGDVEPLSLTFYSVSFEFPESVRFPTLPVRTPSGIIFPRKGKSLCAAPEVFLAQQLGAKLVFRRGIQVPTDQGQPIFKSFIQSSINKRTEHPKGSFENLFWKEVGNSTYGKTAQGLRQKRVYDLRSDDMAPLPESPLTQPFFASFITSFTRAVLGEILNAFPSSVRVFSVTTDGFLSNATDEEISNACKGMLFKAFAKGRNALDSGAEPLEIKHAIRQPIGWRTRGSATLKPGHGESDNVVLQKGGIKVEEALETDEQNRHVIDLFLNRHPHSQIDYTVAVGLKDMVRFDADFVNRSVTKRLSMEFDWKRMPVYACDVDVEFEGQRYSHLSFDTKPHEDFASFQMVRDAWDEFDKKPRRNLKTLLSYQQFQTFIETKKHPDQKVKWYMSRVDGDLKRLKRDLCRAFTGHQAGFDVIRAKRRIKLAEFAEMLTSCGIPCAVSDLDNAKRNVFAPNLTPQTERVVKAITLLRDNHFEDLAVDAILARE